MEFDAKSYVSGLPKKPGIYKMLDAKGTVIYVGKARDLRNRVGSYFNGRQDSPKTFVLVQQIASVDVVVTASENEALLLENNLIKELRPRYNVVLRDDKSYPFIYLSSKDPFPRLGFHRGAKKAQGEYFGPYPSAGSVRESLQLLQKVFPVRQCEDSFFRSRSRPCLQHQIKRCTAPCVGLIETEAYADDVRHARMFLEGKSQQVIGELIARMDEAAEQLDYERAAKYRDQIRHLRRIQEKQYISGDSERDVDIVACVADRGRACVQLFFVRAGHVLGNKAYFPSHTQSSELSEIVAAFLTQYYLERPLPDEILCNVIPDDSDWIAQGLAEHAGRRVPIVSEVRGERARWLDLAIDNAKRALSSYLNAQQDVQQRLELLQQSLSLSEPPSRLECFDISHTQGEGTVASCVVFKDGIPAKSDYRRFNVRDVTPGDDYGAMRHALQRRYRRVATGEVPIPDVLFIDGGKGQLHVALDVLREAGVSLPLVIGVAKGEGRRPGLETLYVGEEAIPLVLGADSGALHLVQHIRDEAHRFAIGAHRRQRTARQRGSELEGINGLGAKRRRALLTHFGGIQELRRAGVEDMVGVPGISRALAQRIYDALHFEQN